MAEWFADGSTSIGATADFVLFNNYAELPRGLRHGADQYSMQVIQLPLRAVLPEWSYLRLPYDEPQPWEMLLEDSKAKLDQMLDRALHYNRQFGILTFVSGFLIPQQNPMGRMLPRNDCRNLSYLVSECNTEIANIIDGVPNAYFFDIDQISACFGKMYIQDDAINTATHGGFLSNFDSDRDGHRIEPPGPLARRYSIQTELFRGAAWAELRAMERTVRQVDQVKLVIVDLDDTLWRGVVAELDDVSDTTIEGWPMGVIESLQILKKRGVLLAIASRNDQATIERLWSTIFRGRIELDDFVSRKINWRQKVDNLADIFVELNVLPQHAVFIDDNPAERSGAVAAFPGLRVLGSDLYGIKRVLQWAPEAQVPFVTRESATRSESTRAGVAREAMRNRLSREEFLSSLESRIGLASLDKTSDRHFARALELINKTNQFNTTGKKRSYEDCQLFFGRGGAFITAEVADKYADYGMAGVLVVDQSPTLVHIEQFVLSCRILGLDVEQAVLAEIVRQSVESGISTVTATLVKTGKNDPCQDVFSRCGFTSVATDPTLWSLESIRDVNPPGGWVSVAWS
ncbi:MAG TPA: HAD-IIIC family phosphatase [Acidimicrobiales bacterium]|jgi:FkbH-like protein|nr:HAD-IIIC family phosphatase [Acidimicrobiales bacterium]